MIESVRRLADLPEAAAKLAAPVVLKVAQDFAKAGTTPYGEAWPAKKDGGRALANADKALSCDAVGSIVRLNLKGVEVIHNYGTKLGAKRTAAATANPSAFAASVDRKATSANKKSILASKKADKEPPKARKASTEKQTLGRYHTPPRQIIPEATDPIPPAYAKAIQRASDDAFQSIVEGR